MFATNALRREPPLLAPSNALGFSLLNGGLEGDYRARYRYSNGNAGVSTYSFTINGASAGISLQRFSAFGTTIAADLNSTFTLGAGETADVRLDFYARAGSFRQGFIRIAFNNAGVADALTYATLTWNDAGTLITGLGLSSDTIDGFDTDSDASLYFFP